MQKKNRISIASCFKFISFVFYDPKNAKKKVWQFWVSKKKHWSFATVTGKKCFIGNPAPGERSKFASCSQATSQGQVLRTLRRQPGWV